MKIIYLLWLIFYKITYIFGKTIEKFLILNQNMYTRKKNSFSNLLFWQKYILVFFYDKINFKRTKYFVLDLENINRYRLLYHPFIYEFINKNNKKKLEKCKNNLSSLTDSFEKNLFLTSYSNYYNNFFFWNAFFVFDFKLNNNVLLVNKKTFGGFLIYLNLKKYIFVKSYNDIIEYNYYNFYSEYDSYFKAVNRYTDLIKAQGNVYKNVNFKKACIDIITSPNIIIIENFKLFYQALYPIKYKPTDLVKLINFRKINYSKTQMMYIRKNKIFNKGRYSRNRQLYRTGVYWCMWFNIIAVFGLYYYFYRFVFNFGYMYVPLLVLILSLFGSRIVKYRFYNLKNLINEFVIFSQIIESFLKDVLTNLYFFIKKFFKKIYKNIKLLYLLWR